MGGPGARLCNSSRCGAVKGAFGGMVWDCGLRCVGQGPCTLVAGMLRQSAGRTRGRGGGRKRGRMHTRTQTRGQACSIKKGPCRQDGWPRRIIHLEWKSRGKRRNGRRCMGVAAGQQWKSGIHGRAMGRQRARRAGCPACLPLSSYRCNETIETEGGGADWNANET